jgi:hypothetical protein
MNSWRVATQGEPVLEIILYLRKQKFNRGVLVLSSLFECLYHSSAKKFPSHRTIPLAAFTRFGSILKMRWKQSRRVRLSKMYHWNDWFCILVRLRVTKGEDKCTLCCHEDTMISQILSIFEYSQYGLNFWVSCHRLHFGTDNMTNMIISRDAPTGGRRAQGNPKKAQKKKN